MALVVNWLFDTYHHLFNEIKDPRTTNFPLANSPFPILIICASYLYFVTNLGPRLMANRKPFELKGFMIAYNILQVVLNFGLATYAFYYSFLRGNYNFSCQLVDYSDTHYGILELRCVYCYYIYKLLDFMDTIIFILRKKNNQVTFLHIYHHIGISLGGYLAIRFVPGGHISVLGILNSYVHVIMYFYYFLTAVNPKIKQSIWWKRYITQVQIIQFAVLTTHFCWPLFIATDCKFPKLVLSFAALQNLFMLVLFSDFYYRAYIKKKKLV